MSRNFRPHDHRRNQTWLIGCLYQNQSDPGFRACTCYPSDSHTVIISSLQCWDSLSKIITSSTNGDCGMNIPEHVCRISLPPEQNISVCDKQQKPTFIQPVAEAFSCRQFPATSHQTSCQAVPGLIYVGIGCLIILHDLKPTEVSL